MHTTWKYNSEPFEEWESIGPHEGYISGWFGEEYDSSSRVLSELWNDKAGVFLFLKMTNEEDASIKASQKDDSIETPFIIKLLEYLQEPLHSQVRFLWIENPSKPLSQWRTNSISVEGKKGAWKVSCLTHIDLRNYSLSIARGTTIRLNKSNKFVFRNNNSKGFGLNAGYGAHRFDEVGKRVVLPMGKDFLGCLQFKFHIKKEGTADTTFGYKNLEKLDVGIRLFMRDSDFPESGNEYYLSSHRYPLFQESSAYDHGYQYYRDTMEFKVSLDPLYPLEAKRTYFKFKKFPTEEKLFQKIGFASCYMTNLGYDVHLIPIPTSKLVMALRPATLKEEEQLIAPFYLVPSGEFLIKIPQYRDPFPEELKEDEFNMICGVSGLEYIKILDGSRMVFNPDQPAYAPSYVSTQSLLRDLTTILESYSSRTLPIDTTDLDMQIEDKREGEIEEAMDITDTERLEILEIIRQDYFPPQHEFSSKDIAEFESLEIVEDLVSWLSNTLQAVTLSDLEEKKVLEAYPTTSWVYVKKKGGAVYYAQPDQAVLYRAESSSKEFLDYMEVPSVGLPRNINTDQKSLLFESTGYSSLAFPMLPYGNVDPYSLTDMLQLEILLLNNYRRNRIQKISEATLHATALTNGVNITPLPNEEEDKYVIGTTPQGLIASYSQNFKTIKTLQLAKDTKDNLVEFAEIEHGSSMKSCLQSNQLFMVITDPDSISKYEVYKDMIDEVTGNVTDTKANFMDIQDWVFELGSDHWKKKGTILIFKFHDKPLLELAAQPKLWSLPDDFNTIEETNETTETASSRLVQLLKIAVEIGKSSDLKERRKYELLARAATQANWTGIIALNVDVPLRNLPDALKALAGGMDPDKFYSQYVGVEVTPVKSTGTALDPQQSSLFGLIDYKNPQIPLADADGYNFHVPFLTVVFQNSQIVAFAAEVLIIMDKLFDEKTTLLNSSDGRNILTLKGVAEEHNGKVTYTFGFRGENIFQLSGKVINEVEIVRAQFATDPLPNPTADPLDIKGRFFFWVRMRFAYNHKFDILSFGATPGVSEENAPERDYLNLSNLQITVAFQLDSTDTDTPDKTFEFIPDKLSFDLERSGWRPQSLYEKFPLKFTSFKYVNGDANALSKSGFMPVKSPFTSADLGSNWYGMTFDLNLGSVGALAGGVGLVVSILAAWVPEQEGVYVGLKLPGSTGGKKEITIQGLLKISFKTIQFVVYPLDANEDVTILNNQTEREVGYLLKLKNIVLKFFVLSFPPSGQTEIILFGDPRDEVDRKDKLLGWYAAYAKK